MGCVNLKSETVRPETGLAPAPVGCLNLKPGTVKPETGLVPVLVGRIQTAVLAGGGLNKGRDPLAGEFEV